MAADNGFDIRELERLNQKLLSLAQKQYPKDTKNFLRKEARKTRKLLRANTKAVTKKKTGNLLKGIKYGPVKKHAENFQIRVYNTAPHAHLIEHGHVMAGHDGKPLHDKFGAERWVDGRYPAAKTTLEMKKEFPEDAEPFIDELLRKGLG